MVRGVISCYEPCRRLAYSWLDASCEAGLPGKAGAAEIAGVSFDLIGGLGRTALSLTHTGLPARMLSKIGAGWHAHLRLLANVLSDDIDVQSVMQQSATFSQRGIYVESLSPRMRA
jgi:hypothetical protein